MVKASSLIRSILKKYDIDIPEPVSDSHPVMIKVWDGEKKDGRSVVKVLTKKRFEYLVSEKKVTPETIFRSAVYDKYFQEVAFGKILNTIKPDISCDTRKNIVIEYLEHFVSSEVLSILKETRFHIVKPSVAYDTHYQGAGGTLGSSCMRNKPCVEFYSCITDGVLCLFQSAFIAENKILDNKSLPTNGNRILARALVWDGVLVDTKEKCRLVDRVYYCNENDIKLYEAFAKENNWLYRRFHGAGADDFCKGGSIVSCNRFFIPINKDRTLVGLKKEVPYIDTFSSLVELKTEEFGSKYGFTTAGFKYSNMTNIATFRSTGGSASFTSSKNTFILSCKLCGANSIKCDREFFPFTDKRGETYTVCEHCVIKDFEGQYIPKNESVLGIHTIDGTKEIVGVFFSSLGVSINGKTYHKKLLVPCKTAKLNPFANKVVEEEMFILPSVARTCEKHGIVFSKDLGCPECFKETVFICPICNKITPDNSKVCNECGASYENIKEYEVYSLSSDSKLSLEKVEEMKKSDDMGDIITLPETLDESFKEKIISWEVVPEGVKIKSVWLLNNYRRLYRELPIAEKVKAILCCVTVPEYRVEVKVETKDTTHLLFILPPTEKGTVVPATKNEDKEMIVKILSTYQDTMLEELTKLKKGKLLLSTIMGRNFSFF